MIESSYPDFCAMINQSKQPKAVALLRLLSVLEIYNEALDQTRRAYYEQVGGKPYCLID